MDKANTEEPLKIEEIYDLAKESYNKKNHSELARALTGIQPWQLRAGLFANAPYCRLLARDMKKYTDFLITDAKYKEKFSNFISSCRTEGLIKTHPKATLGM